MAVLPTDLLAEVFEEILQLKHCPMKVLTGVNPRHDICIRVHDSVSHEQVVANRAGRVSIVP